MRNHIRAISLVFAVANCAVAFGCDNVWTDTKTQELALDSSAIASLDVSTENGAIEFSAEDNPASKAIVIATIRAAAGSESDAELARSNIHVFVEPNAHGGQSVGWRWAKSPDKSWQGEVNFAIRAPGKLQLDAETHNGKVVVTGVVGDTRLVSHNGEIKANAKGGKLDIQTHNGKTAATYDGPSIHLVTHNGEVQADIAQAASPGGSIESHNGAINVVVNEKTSAEWICDTDNGTIRFDVPANVTRKAGDSLRAVTGAGGSKLALSTHNGSIVVRSGSRQ